MADGVKALRVYLVVHPFSLFCAVNESGVHEGFHVMTDGGLR